MLKKQIEKDLDIKDFVNLNIVELQNVRWEFNLKVWRLLMKTSVEIVPYIMFCINKIIIYLCPENAEDRCSNRDSSKSLKH